MNHHRLQSTEIIWQLTSRNHLNAEIRSRCRNKKGSRARKLKHVEALYPVSNMATGGHWRPLAAWTRRSTACASHQLAISWPSQEVQIFCIQLAFGPLGLGKKMTWQTARVQRFHNGNSHDFSGRLTVSPGSDGSGKVSLWQVAGRDLSRDRHVHSTFQSNSVYNMFHECVFYVGADWLEAGGCTGTRGSLSSYPKSDRHVSSFFGPYHVAVTAFFSRHGVAIRNG